MNLKELEASALEARKAEIASECEKDDANLDALLEEVRAINEELESRAAEEAKKAELRTLVATEEVGEEVATIDFTEERKETPTMEVRNTKEYIDAFAKYVRTDDDRECRALLTENVSGSVPVPEFVYGIIEKELNDSPILSRVRHMNAKGNLKVGFEISTPAAGKHTEGSETEMAEEALTLGIVTMVPSTFKKWVSISDEALDLQSGEAYLRYIYTEVARGIVKAKENEVVAKILAAPQVADGTHPSVAKTGAAAAYGVDEFVTARALLCSAARDLVVICTPSQYAQYKSAAMANSYGVDPFDGATVLFNDNATAPIIGDLNGVMMNETSDIQIKFDDKTLMTKDLVRILGRQGAAIEVVGDKYFAKISA